MGSSPVRCARAASGCSAAVLLGAAQGEPLVHQRARAGTCRRRRRRRRARTRCRPCGRRRWPPRTAVGRSVCSRSCCLTSSTEVGPRLWRLHPDRLDADVRAPAAGALLQLRDHVGARSSRSSSTPMCRAPARAAPGSGRSRRPRSAPSSWAARAAIWPTPPAPQTATTCHPALTPPRSAPIQPVGPASEANTAARCRSTASGTRTRRGPRRAPGCTPHGFPRSRRGRGSSRSRHRCSPPQCLGDAGIGVGVVAQRPQIVPCSTSTAARDERAHHHAVTHAAVPDARPDLDDLAEELVADHVARRIAGMSAAEEVQVRAAHRARPHLQDDVLAVRIRGSGTSSTLTLFAPSRTAP